MGKTKLFLFGLLTFSLAFGTALSGQAADRQAAAANTASPAKAPVVIEGDELSFNDLTGDVYANGNVIMTQNGDKILTDLLQGNTKQHEVWMNGNATFLQPGMILNGLGAHYNYQEKTGTIRQAKGVLDEAGKPYQDHIAGHTIDFSAKQINIHDGMITTCPAKVPDYHISATRIEVWPGDKYIAYNAKFWIKNTVIFSLPKYEQSLVKGKNENSAFPRLGYSSHNGVSISQYLEYPIAGRLSAYGDLAYYSHKGFKPTYGLASRQDNYTVSLYDSYTFNGDDEWVHKTPELMVNWKPFRIGGSSWTAHFFLTAGKWNADNVSGWRRESNLYFKKDPILLSKILTFDLGTGFDNIKYGYNQTSNDIWMLNLRLTAKPNDRLTTWVGYNFNKESGTSPYEYDKIDVSHELVNGITYKLDRMDALTVKTSYNTQGEFLKDVDYTWKRNLHCWEADLTYRAKRGEWRLKLSTLSW
ncbi:MAG: hypothetical protein ABFC57_07525 [Veillonellales bacterium]